MSAPPHSVRYFGRIKVGKGEEPVAAFRVCRVQKIKILPTDASHLLFVTSSFYDAFYGGIIWLEGKLVKMIGGAFFLSLTVVSPPV